MLLRAQHLPVSHASITAPSPRSAAAKTSSETSTTPPDICPAASPPPGPPPARDRLFGAPARRHPPSSATAYTSAEPPAQIGQKPLSFLLKWVFWCLDLGRARQNTGAQVKSALLCEPRSASAADTAIRGYDAPRLDNNAWPSAGALPCIYPDDRCGLAIPWRWWR